MMSKRGKKPADKRTARPNAKNVSQSVLDRLAPAELAEVLRTLLKKHSRLKAEAEAIAVEMVSFPSADDIALEVFDAVTSLDVEALHGRAGKHSWGYVEPSQAAWEILEESVEGYLADMKRRLDLGLGEAAVALCRGVVVGLHYVEEDGLDGLLGWAPDFPAEEACYAVSELIRTCPRKERGALHRSLTEALGDAVPSWRDWIESAAKDALRSK